MGKAGGPCGQLLVIVNFILWLIGFATLGYAIWILITSDNASNFLSGTLIFTYSFMAVGILLIIMGVLGCIGGCVESTCCLKAYIALITILLLVDIGLAIAGGVQKDKVFDSASNLWDELNDETKDQIQRELKCCAFNDLLGEYSGSLPDSCYEDSTNTATVYTTLCEDAMKTWVEDQIPIWASVLGGIFLLQIISFVASCRTLKSIEDSSRVGPI